jgi:hypothetical protein
MTKNLRNLAGAAVGAVVALGFTSCAYDPYYSSPAVGASYSSGYGNGYGYGGSGFSTSVFIATGDPTWGYDPNCYSYYNYSSRRYYDPYSYGYYPVGYRPAVVYGVPHPYDWHPGGGYIRPPGRVVNVTLSNYQDREYRYRNSNYGWARQVRQQPSGSSRQQDYRQGQSVNGRTTTQATHNRSRTDSRSTGASSRESQSRYQGGQPSRGSTSPDARKQSNGLPSRYNTPVTSPQQQQARQGQRAAQANKNYRPQPQASPQKGDRPQKSDRSQKQKQSDDDRKQDRQYR